MWNFSSFEDAVDRPHPRAIGAAAHVLKLVASAAVQTEVEGDESAHVSIG
jgi:hypothetical protein